MNSTNGNHDLQLQQRLGEAITSPSTDSWDRMRTSLAERADQRGLLDVAYAAVDSPLGTLTLAATPAGIVRLAFDNETRDVVLGDLATRVSPRVLEAPARLDTARRELDEYFDGARTTFDLPIDWALTTGFRREVLVATAAIRYGRTGTYRSVATDAGNPRAVRAAGTALATNPLPVIIPCHRVTRTDGALGGYRGGTARKEVLLRHEAEHAGAT